MPAYRIFLLPPNIDITSTPAPDVTQLYLHIELLGFPSEAVSELAPGPVDLGSDPILIAQAKALHAMLGDIRAGAPPGEHHALAAIAARAYVFQALTCLISQASPVQQQNLTVNLRQFGPLTPAIRHIEHHLGQPIYIKQLADLCHMGPQWFGRQMRRFTGMSPSQYILERRCAAAAKIMAYSDDAIEIIAERCGFTDRAHFTRVFTRVRKAPPAQFRREERHRLGHRQP